MEINLADGGRINTDEMSGSKALAIEKSKIISGDLKNLTKNHLVFIVNSDNTSFGSSFVEPKDTDQFLDALSNYLYTMSNGYCGVFRVAENNEYGLLIPRKTEK